MTLRGYIDLILVVYLTWN